jgi:gentisate 1,2-dioxygenase
MPCPIGNRATDPSCTSPAGTGTLTLTHVLWSLLNVLPAGDVQRPHRHQSIALDLAVCAPEGLVYTLMGPELDHATGRVKDPVRIDWAPGGAFVTPPGWWHSHHHDGFPGVDPPAIVLPIQDAGLHTYMRSLDIHFASKHQT